MSSKVKKAQTQQKKAQTQTQQKKVQAQAQAQTQQKQGTGSGDIPQPPPRPPITNPTKKDTGTKTSSGWRQWFTSSSRKKPHTYVTLKAEIISNLNKFEELNKAMGEFSYEGFSELYKKLEQLHKKLETKPSDEDFKKYLNEYEQISAQMRFSKDKALQLINKMIEVRKKIDAASKEDEKKKHQEELKKLNKQFDDLLHLRRGAFYNQWWFKLLVGIVIIIGVIFIIGVIVGFIYAYHAESMHFSKTGEWSNARIIKRSAMNWVYVAIFWSQYGIW